MTLAHSSTTSTDAGHLAPHIPLGRDLPVIPGSDAATIRASIDAWDGRIPTAPKTATLTREQLDREIAAAKQHEPYLIGYGGIQAAAAFGGA